MRKAPPAPERADEDPFAELTRIMGFDPRVPFRPASSSVGTPANAAPAAPQQVSAPNVDVSDADLDFSLDLENELIEALEPEMDFAAGEVPAAPRHEAAPSYAPANDEPSLDADALDDMALYDDPGAEEEPAAAPQAAWEPQEAAAYAGEPEAQAFEPSAEHWQVEDEREAEAAAHAGTPAGDEAPYLAPHGEEVAADELEDVLTEGFADEFQPASDDDWELLSEPEWTETEPAAAESPAAPLQAAQRHADEFANDFDAAMAEVDMDFGAAEGSDAAYQADEPFHADDAAEEDELLAEEEAGAVDLFEDELTDIHAAADEVQSDDAPEAHQAFDGQDEPAMPRTVSWRPLFGSPEAPAAAEMADAAEPSAETVAQSEIDEAIAELAAMVRDYDRPIQATPALAAEEQETAADADIAEEILDIDTMDVPEDAVALADDLDIPDVDYEQEPAPSYDDIDAELAAAFGEPAMETVAAPQPAPASAAEFDLDSGYDAGSTRRNAFADMPFALGSAAAALPKGGRRNEIHVVRRVPAHDAQMSEFEVERDPDDELDLSEAAMVAAQPSRRRGLVIASAVGSLAVLGIIGAFAMSGGGSLMSREPVLIKADTDPIKVKPANPGGTAIPNQDSTVFDRATGERAAQPSQTALIKSDEEPVDVASKFPDQIPQSFDEGEDIDDADTSAVAAPKGEDRIEQIVSADAKGADADGTVAVEPRKVRTMIVKPDGSLVPRAEAQPETVGSTTAAKSLTEPSLSQPQGEDGIAQAPPAANDDGAAPAAKSDAKAATSVEKKPAEKARAAKSSVPEAGPVAPARPADQPVDIVGEVKPQQVASTEAPAATAGSWSMQIASQPTQAAAQASYEDLARRYASVLGGRSPSIVKAEIAGKGTFWRVRVPAGSRAEAIGLCEKYKAAGGNCFVSK